QHRHHHRHHARKSPALEPLDDRGQHERQEHRRCDRDEDLLRDAEAEQCEREDDHLQQRLQATERIASARGHLTGLRCTSRATKRYTLPTVDVVAAHAAKHPDRPALIEGARTLTWEQFFRTRNRLAHSLAALGIGVGQHAIVYAHNALENLVSIAALRALGAVGVPMNHRLTADEVTYILDNSDATAVFVDDAFLPMAERVRPVAGVKHWITLGTERRPWAAATRRRMARAWAARWSTPRAPPASRKGRSAERSIPRPSGRDWPRSIVSIPSRCISSRGRSITRRPAASRCTPTWSAAASW